MALYFDFMITIDGMQAHDLAWTWLRLSTNPLFAVPVWLVLRLGLMPLRERKWSHQNDLTPSALREITVGKPINQPCTVRGKSLRVVRSVTTVASVGRWRSRQG